VHSATYSKASPFSLIFALALFAHNTSSVHNYISNISTGRLFCYGKLNQQLGLISRMTDETRCVGTTPFFYGKILSQFSSEETVEDHNNVTQDSHISAGI
jgi:hypothetical protein